MIILNEYPMPMVDHIDFTKFCVIVQPLFKVVSRNTIKKYIIKEYFTEEKEKVKLILSRILS